MFNKTFFSGAILSCGVLFAAPSFAQSASFDVDAVRAACSTSSEACLVAVQAAIATLRQAGLSAAQFNTQLGVIAGTALGAAASLPATERAALAGVLRDVAAASTNAEQVASLTALAARLETDASSVDLTAVAQAFSST